MDILASLYAALLGALTGAGENTMSALLGALVGAMAGGLIIMWHETRRDRKNAAVRMIEEYTSPSFITVRNEGGKALRYVRDRYCLRPDLDSICFYLKSIDKESEWSKISRIEHYYRKLDFLVSINEVDRTYIRRYFEPEFPHWWNNYFWHYAYELDEANRTITHRRILRYPALEDLFRDRIRQGLPPLQSHSRRKTRAVA